MGTGWHRQFLLLLAVMLAGLTSSPPFFGRQDDLAAGSLLQSRIAAARPGDIIWLDPGRTYIGHFVLPPRADKDPRPITLRTSGPDAVSSGTRMDPVRAKELATLRSTLDSRYDDLKSGRVQPIDGDEAAARLKAKSNERRNESA